MTIGTYNIRSPNDFFSAFLAAIGAPVTPNNLALVSAWYTTEGGNWNNTARYNPLNTSLRLQGSTNYSSGQSGSGVQAYTSWDQGISATQQTIEEPQYAKVLALLRSNAPAQQTAQALMASPWDAGHYAGNNPVSSLAGTGSVPQSATLTAATSPSGGATGGGNVFGVPTSPPTPPSLGANPISDLGSIISWATQFGAWTIFTGLVFLFGVILLLLGLVMLGVVVFGPVIGPAAELVPGPAGRFVSSVSRAGRGNARGAPARTAAAIWRPVTQSRSNRARSRFEQQRHENRISEIETRAAASRYRRFPTQSVGAYDEPPF